MKVQPRGGRLTSSVSSFSLCKLMDRATICVSKVKALKALIPTGCMRVGQNVCECPRASFSSRENKMPARLIHLQTMSCEASKHGRVSLVLYMLALKGAGAGGNNGLEDQQYSRGFLVGGGSVRPRYGLFSVSSLRLYFCLPPRTRSRRTPVKHSAKGLFHPD